MQLIMINNEIGLFIQKLTKYVSLIETVAKF